MRIPNTKAIERIKSVLLVVLFFTTVLLLYFFWENASADPFKLTGFTHTPEVMEEAPKVTETVIPTEITASFGDGTYTIISDGEKKLWERALSNLKTFGDAANTSSILVGPISKETYMEAVAAPSIQFQFQYDIPFSEFCEFYGLKRIQAYDAIEGVSTIAYSMVSKESILIYQQKNDKYYALVADKDYTDFSGQINEIEGGSYPSYYPAGTFFGSEVKSGTLIPLSLQSELLEIRYERESGNTMDEKVKDLAESFFGESYDFIRRTTDIKGNRILMYGYGQKIFNINVDGSFEYREKLDNSAPAQSKFFDSLEKALNFVAAHGTWNSLDGTEMSAYLKRVTPISQEKKKGYRFIFGMKLGTQNVYYENGSPIQVDVIGGQVIRYRRNMIDFQKNALETYLSGDPRETFDPVNTITTNYKYIYQQLTDAGEKLLSINDPNAFDDIVERITTMEIGYVRPKSEEEQGERRLLPCYRITFGRKVTLYFSLYNAEPIGLESEASGSNAAQEGGE